MLTDSLIQLTWMSMSHFGAAWVSAAVQPEVGGALANGWWLAGGSFAMVAALVGIAMLRRRYHHRIASLESELRRAESKWANLKSQMTGTLDSLPLALVQVDVDRKICQVNPAFTRIFGYEPSEVLGKSTEFLYADPDQYQRQGRLRFNRSAESSAVPYEVAYRRKDGSVFVSETTAGIFRGTDGEVNGMLGLVADVSSRKLVERALRMNQYSVDHASDAIYWFRRDATMMYANEQALRTLGYTPEEMMRQKARDLDDSLTPDVWEKWWDQGDDAGTQVIETRHRRKDGSYYDCEVMPMLLAFEGEEFVTVHVRDITERKENQAMLRLNQFSSDASQNLVFWIRPNGTLSYVNQAMCQLLGFEAEELLQKTVGDVDVGITHQRWEERWAEMQAKGYEAVETQMVDSSGERHWIELQLNYFDFENQQLLVANGQCISARKKAEAETEAAMRRAEESERRFRDLADSASPLSWTTEKDSGCSWLNKRWLEYCGQPLSEQLGTGWLDVVHPDDRESVQSTYMNAFNNQAPFTLPYRLRRHDGVYRWHTVNAAPRFDETNEFLGYVGMSFDDHETRESRKALEASEAALRNHAGQLQTANEALEQFAYVASHDLKQPLRGIDNLAKWIAEDVGDSLPTTSQNHLEKLGDRVRRMERLLDDLLAYSRAGQETESMDFFDVRQIIGNVLAMLDPPEGFSVRCVGDFPRIFGERAPLEQVFRNLIGNAIKHCGKDDGHVTIDAQVDGDLVRFSVQDDGPGIHRKFQDRVFKMFQTLRPRDEVEGSGIGLAIVKKLVESRGGEITLDSIEGEGATFRFTWPLLNSTANETRMAS